MKERFISELRKGFVVLSAGFVYFLIVSKAGLGLPCVFNSVTGLLCPACGITRMIMAMLRFDFFSAFSYNKLLFVTWPIIAFVLISVETEYIRTGKRTVKPLQQKLLIIEIVLLVLFGIVRNII